MENPMSCPKNRLPKSRLIAAALAMTAACVSTSALAQSMIVRSTGPSAPKYPVGKKLAVNEKITLVAGDRVVLLDKGKTRTLAKPGTHNSSASVAANQTLSTTMTNMISREGALRGRNRGGVTRGDNSAPLVTSEIRAPNLWLLDPRKGGNFCVTDPARLMIWRTDDIAVQAAKVAPQGKPGAAETLDYKAGSAYKLWPTATQPVSTGATYQVTGAGASAPVTIRFELLNSLPETPEGIAATLLERGCTAQLDRLVDTMAEDEAAAG
jgi:hypothetical protein